MKTILLPIHFRRVQAQGWCLLSLLVGSIGSAFAATADPLAEWRIVGKAPTLAEDQAITVAAGSELLRTLDAGRVSVRMVSRPYFSATPADWPALEVGPASLTFLRTANDGAMVLLGDRAVQLPDTITLDGEGRSKQLLDLTLSYDQTQQVATLLIDNRTFELPASAPAGVVTVALAAGAAADWRIESLTVQSIPDSSAAGDSPEPQATDPNLPGKRPTDPNRDVDRASQAAARKRALVDSFGLAKSRDYAQAEDALLRANRHEPGTLSWQIESAGKLTHLALVLRQHYDHRGAVAVALRALEILQAAGPLAGAANPRRQATVHEMAAFLHDELLHDPAAARTAYEHAQRVDRESVRARKGLDELDEARAKTLRLHSER